MTAPLPQRDDAILDFGDVSFQLTHDAQLYDTPSTAERFTLLKSRALIDRYAAMAATLDPKRIVELGIWHGGSTVFFHRLYRPERIVAVDIRPAPSALHDYVRRHGLAAQIRIHAGVSQSDAAALTRILEEEFGSQPIDLVVDDASHLLLETSAAFNSLFPRLRPGGLYTIEDWGWAHWPGHRRTRESLFPGAPALTGLVFELVMASASRPDLVAEVAITSNLVVVTRGHAVLDGAFDVSRSYFGSEAVNFEALLRTSPHPGPDQIEVRLAARIAALLRRRPGLSRLLRRGYFLLRRLRGTR
jgi:hypothetical protein